MPDFIQVVAPHWDREQILHAMKGAEDLPAESRAGAPGQQMYAQSARKEFAMKLYGTLTSPYVRKSRVLIEEKHLPVEFVVSDPQKEGSPVVGWNPLGKVPVLEVGPGSYLFDSDIVARYLDRLDGARLEPREGEAYWKAQWWQALGNGIIDAVVGRVTEMGRLPRTQWPEQIAREEQRVHRAIDAAEHQCPGGRYLVGKTFTMADIVVGVALQYTDFRYPHDWRARAPKIASWYAGIVKRKSFKKTLPPELGKGRRALRAVTDEWS